MTDPTEGARRLDDELLELVRKYPRDSWETHANLGEMARFWLQRHAMFRELDGLIRNGVDEASGNGMEAPQFKRWLARYLQFFLSQLEGHHQIEDHHYFPLFRAAEPRLLRGFEILEGDHDALHHAIHDIAARANALLQQPDSDAVALGDALARFRDTQRAMGRDLLQHLDDEEDLVVPLILDRGEGPLFGA